MVCCNQLLGLFLIWSLNLSAQINKDIKTMRYQIELGKSYIDLLDKGDRYDGWGLQPINDKGISQSFTFKAIYKGKHNLVYTWSGNATYVNQNLNYPETGFNGFSQIVNMFGYGYSIIDKKIRVTPIVQIANRFGSEKYIISWWSHGGASSLMPVNDFIFYEKHWGVSIALAADYFISKNIGIGATISYLYFPWEDTRLEGSKANMNPHLRDNTFPNRKIFLGTINLIYNFGFGKSKYNH